MIEYTIKRTRRKTLAAYVLDDGTVEVRAPLKFPTAEIDGFVRSRERTLRKYISDRLERNAKKSDFLPEIGSEILFLGEKYVIKRGVKCEIRGGVFYVTAGSVKNQVTALYRMAAERIIRERVEYFSGVTGHVPSSVKINSAKSRWGSCSGKGALNFSWFLVMAPPKALDYVVIHELSHMDHMDHSAAFWDEVARYEPEYKLRRAELKTLAARLGTEDWQ